jgi:hypothetical protein
MSEPPQPASRSVLQPVDKVDLSLRFAQFMGMLAHLHLTEFRVRAVAVLGGLQ